MVKPESNKWQKANLGDFFFECPKTLKLGGDRGVDSTVWVFTDERRKLYIETGRYVDVNNEFRGEKYFQEKTLDINGVPGTASYFEFDQKIEDQYQFGSSLLLLKKERIRTNLLMTLFSEDRADKEIAEKIFHSIRIN